MQSAEIQVVFDFLRKLAAHNDRSWFEQNKAEYLSAREAAASLIQHCITELGKKFPLGDLKPGDCMFRIYRDVRFSKNKNPYKTNFAAAIAAGGRKSVSLFSWYLHLEPGNCFLASGLYEPEPAQLSRLRSELSWDSAAFRSILLDLQSDFSKLQGNCLKSAPRGYAADHPEIDLLRYTQFYLMKSYKDEAVLEEGFAKIFADDCLRLLPFLEFLHTASS